MKETIRQSNEMRSRIMREKIMRLTGYSHEQINALMFDIAVEYMKNRGMSEDWLVIWLKEPVFWTWWRQQWVLIDEAFFFKYDGNMGIDNVKPQLQQLYETLHASIDHYPDELVYEKIHNSYEVAGQKILKKIIAKNDNS